MATTEINAKNLGSSLHYFTSNLYQEVAFNNDGNLFLSPFSIATVLSMVYLGADGNTAKQLGDVLYGPAYQHIYHTTSTSRTSNPNPLLTTSISKNGKQIKGKVRGSSTDEDLYHTTPISNGGYSFRSPFSMATILALLYHFTEYSTGKQLDDLPDVKSSRDKIHLAFRKYMKRFDNREPFTLKSANRIYVNESLKVSRNYKSQLKKLYSSPIGVANFYRDAAQTKYAINRWVDENTNCKIRYLIPYGVLRPETLMALVNAVYFKADWAHWFGEECRKTEKRPFHLSPNHQIEHEMMRIYKGSFSFKTDVKLGCRILELPYASCKQSMFIILPNEIDGLSALEEKLKPKFFHGLLRGRGFNPELVQVFLPKFRFESNLDLRDVLAEMGLPDLFNEEKCDLSKMFDSDLPVSVSNVLHKTLIDVNERGTVAPIATAYPFRPWSGKLNPPNIIKFEADHPFMFTIVDKRTKTVLFIGRVKNPQNPT